MLRFKSIKIGAVILFIHNITVLYSFSQNDRLLDTNEVHLVKADSLFLIKDYEKAALNYKLFMIKNQNKSWDNWYKGFKKLRKLRIKQNNIKELIFEIDNYISSLNSEDYKINGKLLFYSGFHNTKYGNAYQGIQKYKLAVNEFKKDTLGSSEILKFILFSYKNLSVNYSRLGDQKSALKYCELGIDLMEIDDPSYCEFNQNKSKFLFHDKNYSDAVTQLSKSLEFCNTKIDSFYVYQYLAEVKIEQDSMKAAEYFLELSSKFDIKIKHQFHVILGEFYIKQNLLKKAKKEFESAIEILKNHLSKRFLIKTSTRYAELLYLLDDKENSVLIAHQVLCYFYTELDSLNFNDRPIENYMLLDVWIIEALYIKAKYFRDKYLESNDEFSLGEATFYYDLLLSHFDKLKSEYYSSSSQYRMGAYSQKIYSEIISFYVDQFNKGQNKDDLKNAFSLAQRANSFVLRNAVSDRKALELARVQQDSLEQYLQLASKVASDASKDSTRNASILIEFDSYKESLLSNYPSYGKYNKEEEISIEKLMSTLEPNTLVLKYYYFDQVMTVIGVSKDLIFAENIPFTEDIDSIINLNLEILSQSETSNSLANSYMSNSKKIYDLVIGDLIAKYDLSSIDHLTIIPDGSLKKVAFNALAIKETGDWYDPSSYLMSKYAVNYLYYCSQLNEDTKAYKSKNGFIGFGIEYEDDFLNEIINDYVSNFKDNVDNSRSISLSPLKFADDEVITSAEILNGTSYINADVTPTHVFSTINDFDVVHFSAHAFVDEEDYLNSFVVLNKDEGENYQFKYSDILNLDLDSELVVLSACQTNSGKSVSGEGLMSLSRAFVQSGSKSTVGAYWNAPDYATKELMTLFYSNLKEGMTKSKAMQQAQIEYLTNDKISSPTIRSPFFWASWALYGNDKPLNMSSSLFDFTSWTSYGLLASIMLIIALFFMHLLRRNKA